MRRLLSALCLLCAGGASAAPARAQELSFQAPAFDAPLPSAEDWKALLVRDARLGFSPRTLILAREAATTTKKLSPEMRAAGWLAVGSAGVIELRPRLEELARSGTGLEQLAAILALGEMSSGAEALLLQLARRNEPELQQCAELALLRTDKAALRRGIEEIAQDSRDPRSAVAAALVVFVLDPQHSNPTPAARLLLELRWIAAREFGLVDGQAWPVLVYRGLCEHTDFISEVVLRSAARVQRAGVRDHLLAALLQGNGEGRVRAAARGMPRELTLLIENQLWKPASPREWTVIFEELEAAELEPYVPELFEAALADPELRYRATLLLARSGTEELGGLLDADLDGLPLSDRVFACRAMGESGQTGWSKRLSQLAQDPELGVRAAALVAQFRLESRKAEVTIEAALADEQHVLRRALLIELAANVRSAAVELVLEHEFDKAKDETKGYLALVLAREGNRDARAWLREALLADPPPPPERAQLMVSALRARVSTEDLELLKQLFPREDTQRNMQLNVELALALTALGDARIQPLLHTALWKGEFEVSLLAGALMTEISGIQSLRDDAANPPASARSVDMRRVGYALGTWGGFPEVEALAQLLRYNSGAPALQGALLGFLSTRTQ